MNRGGCFGGHPCLREEVYLQAGTDRHRSWRTAVNREEIPENEEDWSKDLYKEKMAAVADASAGAALDDIILLLAHVWDSACIS